MSKMRMGHVAGVSLALLLGAAAIAEAQVEKRRPGVPPVTGRQPTAGQAPAQPAGPQVTGAATQQFTGLLQCCVVEGFESSSEVKGGTYLVVKDTKTGTKHRLKLGGKIGSSASSAKFRPGQTVDMNIQKTRIAITPFPVEESKDNKINGNSAWKMWTDVTVSNNGRVDGKTRIKSAEALRGFTGGVEVLLTDRAGNILHQTDLRTYGVNANSERTKNWNETVSADVINKVRRVAIKHTYEPKNRFAASLGWIQDNAGNISTLMECTAKYLGEDEEEEGGGASQGQPSPSEPTALECVEAGQELAEELGF